MSGELFKEGVKKLWVLPLILTIILVLIVPVYTLLEKSAIEESLVIFEQIDESASNANESIKTNLTGAYKEMAGATFIFTPYVMLTVLILSVNNSYDVDVPDPLIISITSVSYFNAR